MSLQKKTRRMIDEMRKFLAEHNPMTVRQVYYQLVSSHVIKNTRSQYQSVSNALVKARQEGTIPWAWIEDRLRQPRHVAMWDGLDYFAETARDSYRLNVWSTQPHYIETWLEKDALSGIFEGTLAHYGVTLNVGRGYDGWDSIYNAASRYGSGDNTTVLYFGDLDPSGEDMVRSLRKRLGFFDCHPEVLKCALTPEDVDRYNLPPDCAKATDTRRNKFVAEYGDVSVEIDALPVHILRARIVEEVEGRMDLDALAVVHQAEESERLELMTALGAGVQR